MVSDVKLDGELVVLEGTAEVKGNLNVTGSLSVEEKLQVKKQIVIPTTVFGTGYTVSIAQIQVDNTKEEALRIAAPPVGGLNPERPERSVTGCDRGIR